MSSLGKPRRRGLLGPASQVSTVAPRISLEKAIDEFLSDTLRRGSTDLYVKDLALWIRDGLRRPRSRNWKPLAKFMGDVDLVDLTKERAKAWLDHVKPLTTANNFIVASKYLKRFLMAQVQEGNLDALPLQVRPPRIATPEIQVFSQKEMERLRDVTFRENVRDWAIFMLLADTGIRATELCQLKVSDFRFERAELHVIGKGEGKKIRIIPLDASLAPLKKYLAARGAAVDQTPYFFLSFTSGHSPVYAGGRLKKARVTSAHLPLSPEPLTRRGLHCLVTKWGTLAKLTEARCSPHTFRHYFAVSYLRNGGDVLTLQKILGHSVLAMTQKYVHFAQADIKRVHRTASPANDLLPGRLRRLSQ